MVNPLASWLVMPGLNQRTISCEDSPSGRDNLQSLLFFLIIPVVNMLDRIGSFLHFPTIYDHPTAQSTERGVMR